MKYKNRTQPNNCLNVGVGEGSLPLKQARKTRKSPGTLGFKKFGLGKIRVKKVLAQNIFFMIFWLN